MTGFARIVEWARMILKWLKSEKNWIINQTESTPGQLHIKMTNPRKTKTIQINSRREFVTYKLLPWSIF